MLSLFFTFVFKILTQQEKRSVVAMDVVAKDANVAINNLVFAKDLSLKVVFSGDKHIAAKD